METFKIYLSGGMGSLSFDEQICWRYEVNNAVNDKYSVVSDAKRLYWFNPVEHYNFQEKLHRTEREVFEYDLHKLRESDLIIVNFNDPSSIGTAMELVLAKEMKIPIIGLNEDETELHPWLVECCTRICDTMAELIDHVVDFYLV